MSQAKEVKYSKAVYIQVNAEDYTYMVLKDDVAPLPGEDGKLHTPEELADLAMAQKPKRYHGAYTAGAYIKLSPRMVRELCETGVIEATKPDNHRWVIAESELDRYLGTRKHVHKGRDKQREALIRASVKPMTDETRGLVTVQQAADYLGFSAEHIRNLYREGLLSGTKVGDAWLMIESDAVREYGSHIIDGMYVPLGFLHLVDFDTTKEVSVETLEAVLEHAKEVIRIEVRLPKDGVEALRELGMVVNRKSPPGHSRKKGRSPLELPKQYAELLEKVRKEQEK